MSLLIASSSKGAKETNQIGVQVPYQFRNHLKNPLIVPPNSEIAVESVKINRIPQLDYGGGVVSNFWFGERLPVNGLDNSLSYFIPSENIIDEGSSPLDFAERFKQVLQESYSTHPEIDSLNIEINIQTDALGGFTGFEFKIPQVGSAQGTSTVPPAATRTQEVTFISDGALDWDGTTFSADGGQVGGQLMPINDQGGPISLHNGSITYNNFTGDNWTVGLSRCIGVEKNEGFIESQDYEPLFGTGVALGDVGPEGNTVMDYCAEMYEDELKLYHCVADTGTARSRRAGEPIRTIMSEIKYYEKNNTSSTANNGSNSSYATGTPIPSASITDITFICNGESVTVQASGNTVVKCVLQNASTKNQIPKPIGQTCWKMYPHVHLWEDNDAVDLAVYECRKGDTIYNNQPENSWITRATLPTILGNGSGVDHYEQLDAGVEPTPAWRNALRWGNEVDYRAPFQIYSPEALPSATTVRTRKGFTSNAIIEDYENIFIMGPSERYMSRRIQEWQPNSMEVLGFSPFAINPDSNMSHGGGFNGASFASATRPSMLSQHSTFIRVPTLTHETYNFGTGNPSKILFQVPRFDNSGTETGALFFQNPDKTYIALNNTDEVRVTDLDVHFVRKDETFAKDLTGSSEVVFHIRKVKM
jgi:hypothetical protein